jgi:CRISPR-associated protein Csm3
MTDTNTTTVIDRFQKPLLGKIIITSQLIVETGLHIGGGAGNLDIGGLDKAVIRDPLTRQPYLPGSSLKGKLRSILERLLHKPLNRSGGGVVRYESDDLESGYTEVGNNNFIQYEGARTCQVSRIFGSTGGTKCWVPATLDRAELDVDNTAREKDINGTTHIRIKGRNSPARLIVRDAHLEPTSAEKLKKIDTGLYMTEWKFENSIDRITSAANPRQFERVPAGSIFKFELVYTVENREQAIVDLKNLAIALAVLEDDALGGHGSRGYGKIRFKNFQLNYRRVDYYQLIVAGNNTPTAEDSIPDSIVPDNDALTAEDSIPDTQALLTRLGNSNALQQFLPGGTSS